MYRLKVCERVKEQIEEFFVFCQRICVYCHFKDLLQLQSERLRILIHEGELHRYRSSELVKRDLTCEFTVVFDDIRSKELLQPLQLSGELLKPALFFNYVTHRRLLFPLELFNLIRRFLHHLQRTYHLLLDLLLIPIFSHRSQFFLLLKRVRRECADLQRQSIHLNNRIKELQNLSLMDVQVATQRDHI